MKNAYPLFHYDRFRFSITPTIKGLCYGFDEDNVKYSYIVSGVVKCFDNCKHLENNIYTKGDFLDISPAVSYSDGEVVRRMVAAVEDGELACFISRYNINMVAIDIDGEYELHPSTSLLVMEGSLSFLNGIVVDQYVMVRERSYSVKLTGKARAILITYKE